MRGSFFRNGTWDATRKVQSSKMHVMETMNAMECRTRWVDAACKNLQTEQSFLGKHLLVWVPLYEQVLETKGGSRLYAAVVGVCSRNF